MRSRISDLNLGTTRCLQLRGQCRNHRNWCGSPASLLPTKSCDMADRDIHMWGCSRRSVNDSFGGSSGSLWNGVNFVDGPTSRRRLLTTVSTCRYSASVWVLRVLLDPELRGKPV